MTLNLVVDLDLHAGLPHEYQLLVHYLKHIVQFSNKI